MFRIKSFTVLIAVYGGKEALELTLRTLIAVGSSFIETIILVDSSYRIKDPRFQATADFIKTFAAEHSFVKIIKCKKHPHGKKLDVGILQVKTPYTLILDSDVEFHDGTIFRKMEFAFAANDKLFMVGHGDVLKINSPRYWEEENLYVGALFVRTDLAVQYVTNGVSFYRSECVENRTGYGQIRIFYDVSSYMYKRSVLDGYTCMKKNMDKIYFTHLEHASHDCNQNDEFYQGINNKLKEKVWEKLKQGDPLDHLLPESS